jgi:hypothetical protein
MYASFEDELAATECVDARSARSGLRMRALASQKIAKPNTHDVINDMPRILFVRLVIS